MKQYHTSPFNYLYYIVVGLQTAKLHKKGWAGYQIGRISGLGGSLDSRYRDTQRCGSRPQTGYPAIVIIWKVGYPTLDILLQTH